MRAKPSTTGHCAGKAPHYHAWRSHYPGGRSDVAVEPRRRRRRGRGANAVRTIYAATRGKGSLEQEGKLVSDPTQSLREARQRRLKCLEHGSVEEESALAAGVDEPGCVEDLRVVRDR
jgi:hypothetical protein